MSRIFLNQSPISLVVLATCLQLPGCVGRQIGSEIELDGGNSAGEGGPHCEEARVIKLESAESAEGTNLNEQSLAAAIAGEFETSLAWNGQVSSDVIVTPGSGNTEMSVLVEPVAGSAEWVEMKLVEPEESDGSSGELAQPGPIYCSDFLRMDAKVTVKTANGALDDTFVASFSTSDGNIARGEVQLAFDKLKGTFDVDVSALDNASASGKLSLAFAYGSMSGRIEAGFQTQNSEVASAGNLQVGIFPRDNPCENRGVLIGMESDLSEKVDAVLQAHTAFDFTWQGEEAFVVNFTPTLTGLCYRPSATSESSALGGALSLAVSSPGGEIAGTWPLSLNVELDDAGEVVRLGVSRDAYIVDSFPSAQFEEETGISGLVSNAEELSFTFDYSVEVVDDSPASGALTILELVIPDCAREGFEPEVIETSDGESGSSGCEGTSVVEAKFAELRER